jgi:multidrug efflux system outer membrane protein
MYNGHGDVACFRRLQGSGAKPGAGLHGGRIRVCRISACRQAGVDARPAEATYREFLAKYRQTVLTAFREVEDSLAQVTFLGERASAQTEALVSSKRVTELAGARYEAGEISYLDVIDAERTHLEQENGLAQLQGQRFAAAVRLIKAPGGGWE